MNLIFIYRIQKVIIEIVLTYCMQHLRCHLLSATIKVKGTVNTLRCQSLPQLPWVIDYCSSKVS